MEIFNESKNGGSGSRHILIIDSKEAKDLVDMSEEAIKHNKRKTRWKKISKRLNSDLCCY